MQLESGNGRHYEIFNYSCSTFENWSRGRAHFENFHNYSTLNVASKSVTITHTQSVDFCGSRTQTQTPSSISTRTYVPGPVRGPGPVPWTRSTLPQVHSHAQRPKLNELMHIQHTHTHQHAHHDGCVASLEHLCEHLCCGSQWHGSVSVRAPSSTADERESCALLKLKAK